MSVFKVVARFTTRAASTQAASKGASKDKPSKDSPPKAEKRSEISALKRFVYNWAGFNKYGLYHNDCLDETVDVKEAIRRLPQNLRDERNFRIVRAMQLSMMKVHLPKEEWTKIEDDKRYLEPYLRDVVKEREEREDWNKN